jgi:hypothetical protein
VGRKQRNTLRFATLRLKWKTDFRHKPHQTFIPDAERPIVANQNIGMGITQCRTIIIIIIMIGSIPRRVFQYLFANDPFDRLINVYKNNYKRNL